MNIDPANQTRCERGIYQLREPNEVPTDIYDNPLKIAVPCGKDCPFEKDVQRGYILVSMSHLVIAQGKIRLKKRQTQPITMEVLSSWSGFSK